MKINGVQFITTKTSVGRGANDGCYYPAGLLTIAAALQNTCEDLKIWIDDQHLESISIRDESDVVGVQVASTLSYKNALEIASQAKAAGKIVVLGGPHVTALPEQILRNQPGVDFLIRGKGEEPIIQLIEAIEGHRPFEFVESLSWRQCGQIIHNQARSPNLWRYDNYTPLPLDLLSSGVQKYFANFRSVIDDSTATVHAVFLIFSHFGCGYRAQMIKQGKKFCSFCSLSDHTLARDPNKILEEIKFYLETYCKTRDRIHLKCYGDNIGWQGQLIKNLRDAIEKCPWWNNYNITWTFYCSSSSLTKSLEANLRAIGTSHLFIGFDSADDTVQEMNYLGTSCKIHKKAVELCLTHGIKIQAGSVVGLLGETPETLETNLRFYQWLINTGAVERINSAILFIIPGSSAYEKLAIVEPQIRELDLFRTNEIRNLWIKHFCPTVSLKMLQKYAGRIDELSPGPHASMGYERR